jgi:CheY-like chemotaxis protein
VPAERREAILCVDDEVVILLALRQELRRRFGSRFVVEIALDDEDARKVAADLDSRGVRTAIVITDWIMPGTRGDRLVMGLRESWPGIKSILMTGQADEESVREARKAAGFDACLTKPWRPDELYAAIEGCLEG